MADAFLPIVRPVLRDENPRMGVPQLRERRKLPLKNCRVGHRLAHLDVVERSFPPRHEVDLAAGKRSDTYLVAPPDELKVHHILGNVTMIALSKPDDAISQPRIHDIVLPVGAQALLPPYVEAIAAIEQVSALHR